MREWDNVIFGNLAAWTSFDWQRCVDLPKNYLKIEPMLLQLFSDLPFLFLCQNGRFILQCANQPFRQDDIHMHIGVM